MDLHLIAGSLIFLCFYDIDCFHQLNIPMINDTSFKEGGGMFFYNIISI